MPAPKSSGLTGSELFIVDNSDADWKVRQYLHDWCQLSQGIDVATGYFEIGSLLALDGEWQKVDKIRLLMGDEVSRRTKKAFVEGLEKVKARLDQSLEAEKEKNDFLVGVPAIVEAIRSSRINCRVYRKEKFHAKAYITHARQAVVGSFALVGSSNFTYPGLSENVELNVQIVGRQVAALQEWYENHWSEAEDVTPEILRTIERHTAEHLPFEIYAKALQEFFRSHEMTVGEWELAGAAKGGSRVYPTLDKYQRDGYQSLMKIANQHGGAFLCDGVGLGKTFIGMMLIERLVEKDRQRVALFVPKAARGPVWEAKLHQYLPHIGGDFSSLAIYNHSDLLRGGEFQERLDRIAERADVIMIDEAHHFRNPRLKGEQGERKSRYWRLFDIAQGKKMFLLTATPVNNRLIDLQHMIELFTQRRADYFKEAPLGIHSLSGHFRRMEKELERLVNKAEGAQNDGSAETNELEAEKVLGNDELFHALVVQRSRAYVKESQQQHGGAQVFFPEREPPRVAEYSIKKTYGRLLDMVETAFSKEKPLFSLAVYYPLAYYRKPKEETEEFAFRENRQKQLVRLIRIQFLKRFESSARAFEMSCETLLLKLLAWVTKHSRANGETRRLDRWRRQNTELVERVQQHQQEYSGEEGEEFDEDIITDEMLEDIEELDPKEYKVDEILAETYLDLDQIAVFLNELKKFKPTQDDKLNALIKLLKTDPVLKKNKLLIFSEFMATARYLKKQLADAGIGGVDEVDSADKRDRGEVIKRFAPYYNDSSTGELNKKGASEIRVLVSTDVLSEGLNLQDSTRLINYDLHWNPVRLMQRIGRVDRRLDPIAEKKMLSDHPDLKDIRGKVVYWNFLPPNELDDLLRLYRTVSHKVLRISKTFGIEGKKLLKPDDDYEALKEFNEAYEGSPSASEAMRLEWQKLLDADPDLEGRLNALPGRVFSGKKHPKAGANAVFFCYALPAPGIEAHEGQAADPNIWSEAMGQTAWYLYDLDSEEIVEEPTEIIKFIRSKPDTPRHRVIADRTLSEIRAKIEKHITNAYFKRVQAPLGVKAALKAWMELS